MTNASAHEENGSQQVFRLIYSSHSRIAERESATELGEIFTTARRNNKRLGITGALVITDDAFAQALEGDEKAVRGLYESICKDPRHDELTVLQETVEPRRFGRWAMAQVSEDGGPDIRLLSNASKGKIVAASPDVHVTPEQETVLAFMRDAIAREPLGQ
jgi:FAD-dependent sensor of blue light